jgi:ABC-2 type transport system ATP-binding protein
MAVTADQLIVIGRGKLIVESSTEDVIARSTDTSVRVRSPQADRLATLIEAAGGTATADDKTAAPGQATSDAAIAPVPVNGNGAGLLTVTGLNAARIGEIAASAQIVLHELTPLASLEEAFMELTSGSLEFGRREPRAGDTPGNAAPASVTSEPAPADVSNRSAR